MKKILVIIFVLGLFSFKTNPGETRVSFKSEDVQRVISNLGNLYNYLEKSQLPHQDVLSTEQMLKESIELLQKADTISSTSTKKK